MKVDPTPTPPARNSISSTSRCRRAAVVAVVLGLLSACATDGGADPVTGLAYSKELSWQTFSNAEFGFEIRIPPGWQIAVFTERVRPVFTIYPGNRDGVPKPPFTFREEIPNVTICPRGCAAGTLFGRVFVSLVALAPGVGNARDYTLQNKSQYGTIAGFSHTPPGWNENALIWARAKISKLKKQCLRKGRKVKNEDCDPAAGDKVIYKGKVDRRMIEVLNRILRSFRFEDLGFENAEDLQAGAILAREILHDYQGTKNQPT